MEFERSKADFLARIESAFKTDPIDDVEEALAGRQVRRDRERAHHQAGLEEPDQLRDALEQLYALKALLESGE